METSRPFQIDKAEFIFSLQSRIYFSFVTFHLIDKVLKGGREALFIYYSLLFSLILYVFKKIIERRKT